jgi:hypothetical protein
MKAPLVALAAGLLFFASAASAQDVFTDYQFKAAIGDAYAIEVDSVLLRQVAADAHVTVPARTLEVYVVPGDGFACRDGRCAGIWVKTAQVDYVIVAATRLLREPWLMRHEYLHHVLQTGDHPPAFRRLGLPVEDRT